MPDDRRTLEDVDADEIIVTHRPSSTNSSCFHLPHPDHDEKPLCHSRIHSAATWRRVHIENAPLSVRHLCRRCESRSDDSDFEVDTGNQGPHLNTYLHDDDISSAAEAVQQYMADRNDWERDAA